MYETQFHSKDLSNYSFLVTGGAGFIGSNLVEYLLKYKARKVRVIDNLSNGHYKNLVPFKNNLSFEFIKDTIADADVCLKACEGMDYVLHQAALGSVPRSLKNPLATHEANATGFLNMLDAARQTNIKRFVFASSSSVYGDDKHMPKKESQTGNLLSPYAVSKYTNELYAKVFALNYGMEVIGLRYFNVFGPNQSPDGAYAAVIPLFMKALMNNESAYINGDGNQCRDFTFIENAVQANIKAIFTEHPEATGKIYNAAVGETTSINDLFAEIKNLAGASAMAMYQEDRKGDIKDSLADITEARTYLGYNPYIKIKEGLKITYDWFKKS